MRKITKREKLILACIALAVVLAILLIVAAFNSCGNEKAPDPTNPTGQNGEVLDPTGENVDGTTPDGTKPNGTTPEGTTPDGTTPDGTVPGGTTEPEIIPSVSLGIVDRDDFGNDDPTDPTQPKPTNPTTPTDPKPTNPTNPTQPTEPEETTEPPTMPEVEGIKLLTWEEYQALSGKEQRAYKESFPNRDDYYAWLDAAQAAYKAEHESEFGGGGVDIGEIINGNNNNP